MKRWPKARAQRIMAFFSPTIICVVYLGIARCTARRGPGAAGGLEVGKIMAFVNYTNQLMRIFLVLARFVRLEGIFAEEGDRGRGLDKTPS